MKTVHTQEEFDAAVRKGDRTLVIDCIDAIDMRGMILDYVVVKGFSHVVNAYGGGVWLNRANGLSDTTRFVVEGNAWVTTVGGNFVAKDSSTVALYDGSQCYANGNSWVLCMDQHSRAELVSDGATISTWEDADGMAAYADYAEAMEYARG